MLNGLDVQLSGTEVWVRNLEGQGKGYVRHQRRIKRVRNDKKKVRNMEMRGWSISIHKIEIPRGKKEQSDQNIWRNNGPEFTKIKEIYNIWDCKVS